MKQFKLCAYIEIKLLKWSKKMTWHKHLKFHVKIAQFAGILFNQFCKTIKSKQINQ